MRSFLELLLVATSIFSQAAHSIPLSTRGTVSNGADWSSVPIPPRQDPWYSAPDGFEKAAPGSILRVRPAPGNLTTVAGSNCSAALNILYRTTDSKYDPTWAVTTLFIPTSISPALLSYQIPYDSADLDASPSYALYSGVSEDITDSLGKGYFVNVPDYEGPLASFTAGVISGHATLDSVRAVLNVSQWIRLPSDTKYAMWGYSGGALASEWAAELQSQYAPELSFSGAALGGLTPNVINVFTSVNGGVAAGLLPAGVIGLASQYPEIVAELHSRLKPSGEYNSTGFLATLNMTSEEAILHYYLQDITKYFVNGFDDIFNNITYPITFNDGIMGHHGIPQMPLFVYKAVNDEISAVGDTDKLVAEFCQLGVNIFYQRNSIGGHSAEAVNGRPAAMLWLDSVFDGSYSSIYNATGCTFENVAQSLSVLPYKD